MLRAETALLPAFPLFGELSRYTVISSKWGGHLSSYAVDGNVDIRQKNQWVAKASFTSPKWCNMVHQLM